MKIYYKIHIAYLIIHKLTTLGFEVTFSTKCVFCLFASFFIRGNFSKWARLRVVLESDLISDFAFVFTHPSPYTIQRVMRQCLSLAIRQLYVQKSIFGQAVGHEILVPQLTHFYVPNKNLRLNSVMRPARRVNPSRWALQPRGSGKWRGMDPHLLLLPLPHLAI